MCKGVSFAEVTTGAVVPIVTPPLGNTALLTETWT